MMPIRLVIDTNIFISWLIKKNISIIEKFIYEHRTIILFSEQLTEEIIKVVERPKFSKYFLKSDVVELFEFMSEYIELVDIKSSVTLCRDPKDDFLLNMSIDGKADFLITGDSDLLELKSIQSTKIITLAEYLCKLNSFKKDN